MSTRSPRATTAGALRLRQARRSRRTPVGRRSPRLDGVTAIEAALGRQATGRAGRRIKRGARVTDRFGCCGSHPSAPPHTWMWAGADYIAVLGAADGPGGASGDRREKAAASADRGHYVRQRTYSRDMQVPSLAFSFRSITSDWPFFGRAFISRHWVAAEWRSRAPQPHPAAGSRVVLRPSRQRPEAPTMSHQRWVDSLVPQDYALGTATLMTKRRNLRHNASRPSARRSPGSSCGPGSPSCPGRSSAPPDSPQSPPRRIRSRSA